MLDKEIDDYIRQEIEATKRKMEMDIKKLNKYPDKAYNEARNIMHNQGYIHALRNILYIFGDTHDVLSRQAEESGRSVC